MRLEVLFAMEYILVVDCERRLQRIIAAEARRQFSLPGRGVQLAAGGLIGAVSAFLVLPAAR